MSYCAKLPSEYLSDNLFVGSSFMCHTEAQAAVRDGYYTNCMWGSDYPHTEGTFQYPDSWDEYPVTHIAQRYAYYDTPEEPIRAMLGETAARVYGLDLDELRAVAARINAPTIPELHRPIYEAPSQTAVFAALVARRSAAGEGWLRSGSQLRRQPRHASGREPQHQLHPGVVSEPAANA